MPLATEETRNLLVERLGVRPLPEDDSGAQEEAFERGRHHSERCPQSGLTPCEVGHQIGAVRLAKGSAERGVFCHEKGVIL